MNLSLLQILSCPAGCSSLLEVETSQSSREAVQSGVIGCAECGGRYPIEDGIPRMLPESLAHIGHATENKDDDDSARRKRSEMAARDAQVEDYDRMWYLNLFGLIEIPAMLANLALSREHILLEAGCGTGRMTQDFAARCRRMIAVDYSWESLRVNAAKLRKAGVKNVELVQADICHLPFRTDSFDRTVSCQVLEHIPSPDCREMAVSELGRVTQAGGNIALSAYQYSLLARFFGEKEGEHDGGIYFFRFSRDELTDLLSRRLKVESVTGALVYHYIARCRKQVISDQ